LGRSSGRVWSDFGFFCSCLGFGMGWVGGGVVRSIDGSGRQIDGFGVELRELGPGREDGFPSLRCGSTRLSRGDCEGWAPMVWKAVGEEGKHHSRRYDMTGVDEVFSSEPGISGGLCTIQLYCTIDLVGRRNGCSAFACGSCKAGCNKE
jgi:hypothetical protein